MKFHLSNMLFNNAMYKLATLINESTCRVMQQMQRSLQLNMPEYWGPDQASEYQHLAMETVLEGPPAGSIP